MRLHGTHHARTNARHLRRALSPPEIELWLALRRNDAGLRFRRQHPAGQYVLDFYCAPVRLVIEVDGFAHDTGNQPDKDARRDEWLGAQGVRVLRYPAGEVRTNLAGVVADILAIALSRRPPPSG